MKLTSILSTSFILAGVIGTLSPATLAQRIQPPQRPIPPNDINAQPPEEPPISAPPGDFQRPPIPTRPTDFEKPPIATPPDDFNNQPPVEQAQGPDVGIQMLTLTPELAKKINSGDFEPGWRVAEKEGVLIARVRVNTPAMAAGLREGDLIVELQGQPITNTEQVQKIVANSGNGQSLSFKVQRGDQTSTVTVRLEDQQPTRRPEELPSIQRPNFDRPNPERPNFDRPNPERPNFDRPNPERPNFNRPNPERPNFNRPNPERPNFNRPNPEQPNFDRPNPERPNFNRPNSERPNFDRPISERPNPEPPNFNRPNSERPNFDRPISERPNPEPPNFNRPNLERRN